jgi:hypothetical protein
MVFYTFFIFSESDVDLRVIVLAFDRHKSLNQCLNHLHHMHTDGDNVLVDIYIDKIKPDAKNHTDFNSQGHHAATVKVAQSFRFKGKPVNIHFQKEHVGLYGQWLDSWKPTPDTKEIGLFVEDDQDVSPYFWLWLKAAYCKYRNDPDVMGIALRQNDIAAGIRAGQWLITNPSHNALKYKVLFSHGFAPFPR